MITATNILNGIFRSKKRAKSDFKKITWTQEKILKHQEDQNVKVLSFGKFKVWYKRPYELLHTYKEIFEKEIYKFRTEEDKPVIIDCGANIGLSLIYFKQLYPASTIIAFEPDQQNFKLLEQNVSANDYTNVQLNQAAVWEADGEISFEANETEASHISEAQNATRVKSIRLKNVLESCEKVDFLKVDIEGAEWQVVMDSRDELKKVDHFFLEYHGKVSETNKLNDLLDILYQQGFNVYIKNAADNLDHPFVRKTTRTIYDVQLNLFCTK
jgi:FkbM family methyltransferase